MKLSEAITDVFSKTAVVPSYRALIANSRAVLRQDAEISLINESDQVLIQDTSDELWPTEQGENRTCYTCICTFISIEWIVMLSMFSVLRI